MLSLIMQRKLLIMEKIGFNAEHAYGIGKLNREFDTSTHRGISLYAPNGTCKTSLLKAIQDYAKGDNAKDLFFQNRESLFEINFTPPNSISKQNVYCFESMQSLENMDFFDSDLLASPLIKEKFVDTLKDLEKTKTDLLLNLRNYLANKSVKTFQMNNVENLITRFGEGDDFFTRLKHIVQEASEIIVPEYISNSKMASILSNDNKILLEKQGVQQGIADYANTQKKLVSESGIFDENFTFTSAESFLASLKKAAFFEAGHKVVLHNHKTGDSFTFASFPELQKHIKQELLTIASSPEITTQFEKVEKSLGTTAKAEKLRLLLKENQEIVPYLNDVSNLEKIYLFAAIKDQEKLAQMLLEKHTESQEALKKLQKEIASEKTAWHKALGVFQARFRVPFEMKIENREDVLLKEETPRVAFYFEGHQIQRNTLLPNLSTGERKAMYMLNIIFEMDRVLSQGEDTLLVFDDIVDSFDYANKYAFIEYLRDFMLNSNVYIILLTHNYDFFRTVTSRIEQFHRKNCQLIECDDQHVMTFEVAENISKNLLSNWKNELDHEHTLIATIPMVRELVAIAKGSGHPDYSTLSNILHGRPEGDSLCFNDISAIYEKYWECDSLKDDHRKINNLIIEECSQIASNETRIKMVQKITLSIGTRIQIERYIKTVYASHNEVLPEEKTLGKLVQKFKERFVSEYDSNAEVIEQALIMVPENIHINAFMYEPLVDIGSNRFKKLYTVAALMRESV